MSDLAPHTEINLPTFRPPCLSANILWLYFEFYFTNSGGEKEQKKEGIKIFCHNFCLFIIIIIIIINSKVA